MAKWRINITPQRGKPAKFEFAQRDPDVRVGDQVFWRNDDKKEHFPVPDGEKYALVSNQIAPKSSSSAFAPSRAGTINYHCKLHDGEKGSIKVTGGPKKASFAKKTAFAKKRPFGQGTADKKGE